MNRVKVPELPQELRALEAEMTMTDNENELVEDSDDDLSEIDVDSETEQIIQSVFGSDSEAEDSYLVDFVMGPFFFARTTVKILPLT